LKIGASMTCSSHAVIDLGSTLSRRWGFWCAVALFDRLNRSRPVQDGFFRLSMTPTIVGDRSLGSEHIIPPRTLALQVKVYQSIVARRNFREPGPLQVDGSTTAEAARHRYDALK
jgi:hypothetical protein